MKKVLKWIGIVLGGLVGLVLVVAIAVVVVVRIRMAKHYDVTAKSLTVPTDAASIARGEHLVKSVAGCTSCHGENLGGTAILDDPMIMTLYAPNLTSGKGGAASTYTVEDWDRAIRHGVGPDGKPLIIMPSENFRWMTDDDLVAVVSYINSLKPVDNQAPGPRLGPMGYFLAITQPVFLPARMFDTSQSFHMEVTQGVTTEYGNYLVWLGTCRDCHGGNLSGRQLPLPGEPPSRNLTPAGELAGWSQQDFIQTIRTGVTPSGHTLQDPMAGVVDILRGQTDDELSAIFMYLQSLPPKKFGSD